MSTSKPNARAQNGKLVLVVVLVLRSKGPYSLPPNTELEYFVAQVGLAVGDIESIQRTASLRTLIDDALLIEGIMRSYPAFILRRVHKDSLKIFPNRNTMVKRWV